MALNDAFRIDRVPLGLGIGVGTEKLQVREGYVILPKLTTAQESTTELGSVWNNSDTGINRTRDAAGVRDL